MKLLKMNDFLLLFGEAVTQLNQIVPPFQNQGNQYQDGIGPYSEDKIVSLGINRLLGNNLIQNVYIRPNANQRIAIGLNNYLGLNNRAATPDLVFENKIIEFKICRPLGDNGNREDTWFKKVFEPNPQSYSTFLDVLKLCKFRDQVDFNNQWEKWVVVIGFERLDETEYSLDLFFPSLFEFISNNIVNQRYIESLSSTHILGDRHLYHQVLKLYAYRY